VPEIKEETEAMELEFVQSDLPKLLESMRVGTHRIREIVLSLRNFSRADESDFKAVEIHEGIESTLLILQHKLKARADRPAIQVTRDYGDLPKVECYPGPLNQVFMNLLANAIDAIEEGMVKSEAGQLQPGSDQITIRTARVNEQWVEIGIADNGPGIPPEIQGRLFDPFFTTKAVGKGTGMGLSISHQIITEKHRGKLVCNSSPGQGTEFIIQIPLQQSSSA
jgi:two-component system NtrC family sensor kinase